MTDLFRKEAVSHATRRLSGTVVLATPLSVRLLGLFFGGIVVAVVLFASMASFARKATVTGWLIPDLGLIRATAIAAGSVQAVTVREGEVVEAGARLAEIRIGSETAAGNVGEMVAQQLRTEAEATRERARSRIERLNAETEQSLARLVNLRVELQQIQTQAALQEQRLESARQELARGEDIAARGLLARRELEARRQAALTAEQDLAGQRRQTAAMEREIADINARISAIIIEKETTTAESRLAEASLEQRIIDAEARRVQLVLAPVAGRIAALPVTAGQPVALGATLAVIVPQGGKLEAELLAPTRAVGFVRPGQEVSLMLQAFPHQRFGTVKGRVRTMSNTVLGPTEISIPGLSIQEPVFRVRVALSRDVIEAYGETVPLQPGMLLSADIVFDRRSLIQWLFDPLFAVAQRS
jgi:membrane fusion protein